ncbi:MAG: DUF4105 domain-containing protein [Deltaproteobacteria bacterium]|nr:DUF4105 domain-containing protein [Deltaproteobacteria bacterium]
MTIVAIVAALLASEPGDLERALTPALREVLHPLPELLDGSRAARLAWVAELGRRADRRHRHSDARAWRVIMGWPEAEDEGALTGWDRSALDRSLGRYPVPRGKVDPATDLAASVALAWLDPGQFACQFPLRARFLRERGLGPPEDAYTRRRCAAFEAWARSDDVVAIDVIYVGQRWVDAAATMGHVIFRIRERELGVADGPSFARVFSYVAKDPTDTPGYMLRGLTGGLTAGVHLESMGDVVARYGLSEGRDMQVFELALSPDERRLLLAEVFAQMRHDMRIPYAFLSVNCASMAWDTLRAVLPELPRRAELLVHPHEVVSMLVAAGRAAPREVLAARKTRAIAAEAAREWAGAPTSRPEVAAVHAARWGTAEERTRALEALARSLEDDPIDPARGRDEATALARYLDEVLDIESFAVDQALRQTTALATSPALDAALAARAALPQATVQGQVRAPEGPIRRAGSRRGMISADWTSGGRALVGWRAAVLAEEAGEARVIGLRRASRMRLLDNALTLSTDGRGVALEEERLTVLASATWGTGVRTDEGWLASRLGFGMALETWSRPRDGMPFAIRAALGPGLTLLASDDFGSHLVIASELALASWTGEPARGAAFRASLGLALESALTLGSPLVRLLARGRMAPALDLDGGQLELEATLALDLAAAPDDGVFLRISASFASGLPAGDGWTIGASVSF